MTDATLVAITIVGSETITVRKHTSDEVTWYVVEHVGHMARQRYTWESARTLYLDRVDKVTRAAT